MWCNRLVVVGLVSLLSSAIGCGDGIDRVPIKGLVVAQGGLPLPSAAVQFTPKGSTPGQGAIGQSNAEGKFTVISSREEDTGIPPGVYTVRVSLLVDSTGKPLPPDATQADYPDAREAIPAPYSSPGSPMEVTIDAKGGELKIEIPAKIKALKI